MYNILKLSPSIISEPKAKKAKKAKKPKKVKSKAEVKDIMEEKKFANMVQSYKQKLLTPNATKKRKWFDE